MELKRGHREKLNSIKITMVHTQSGIQLGAGVAERFIYYIMDGLEQNGSPSTKAKSLFLVLSRTYSFIVIGQIELG